MFPKVNMYFFTIRKIKITTFRGKKLPFLKLIKPAKASERILGWDFLMAGKCAVFEDRGSGEHRARAGPAGRA